MIVTQSIPPAIAERYLASLKGLASTVHAAVDPPDHAPQASGCRSHVLPLIENQLSAAQVAMNHYAIGDQEPLISLALRSRYLARETDGHSLAFAGQELAAQYEDRRRMIVFSAWQVCEAAGVV
jgi:hypothetical protein